MPITPRIVYGGTPSVAAGNSVLFGAGAPANGLGAVGDVYFDTSNHVVYKKTAPAVWTAETNYTLGNGLAVAQVGFTFLSPSETFQILNPIPLPSSFIQKVDVKILTPFGNVGSTVKVGDDVTPDRFLDTSPLTPPAGSVLSSATNKQAQLFGAGGHLTVTLAVAGGEVAGAANVYIYYSNPLAVSF